MSLPSIDIHPFSSSIMRERVSAIVDLPAPVRPQTPIFWPASMLKVKPLRTISVFGLYLSSTPWNDICPFGGQSAAKSSPPTASYGILLTVISLWTDCNCVWKRLAVLSILFAVFWTSSIYYINKESATESTRLLWEMQNKNEMVRTTDFSKTPSKLLRASTLCLIWDMRISRWQRPSTFSLKDDSLPKARMIEFPV